MSAVEVGLESGFFELPAGSDDLVIATPDSGTDLIDPAAVTLSDGDIVTLFAVGDGTNQPPGITAVSADGSATSIALEGEFTPIPVLGPIGLLLMAGLPGLVAVRRPA